jgi:DNA-directed RNA polymerase specialized sigma24 family protein
VKSLRPRSAAARSRHARKVRRRSPLASVARQVELPLPASLRKHGVGGGSVALVDVEGGRLKLRFLRSALGEEADTTLAAPEAEALARGGVGPLSAQDIRAVEARTEAAYRQLRADSLSVEEAARRLGVNTSRVRQRLAERSLYGLKEGHTWWLPAFQFKGPGLVPGVEAVVRRLPADIGPLAVTRWFRSPNPDLTTRDEGERPVTPLQWLLAGNPPQPVAALAAAL